MPHPARMPESWDYLIVTAANELQAKAYRKQISLRRELELLSNVREVLVVGDPGGVRVGSGGSTLFCLFHILEREVAARGLAVSLQTAEQILRSLRVLIIHAGGDSRRLPAYSSCGKIFVSLPGDSRSAFGDPLFDRLASTFLALPPSPPDSGQIVITSGDALLLFDPSLVDLGKAGITMLGGPADPDEASRHGVFCASPSGTLRIYLQKPSIEQQAGAGAITRYGKSVLDLGVMSLDARSAMILMETFGVIWDNPAELAWEPSWRDAILAHELDLYREVCCALGAESTFEHYSAAVRSSGSRWACERLSTLFATLHTLPANLEVLDRCQFLHFGATSQLTDSGLALLKHDQPFAASPVSLCLNSQVLEVAGENAWLEGCLLSAPVTLAGRNVLIGVEADQPLELPERACLDVQPGFNRSGARVWFVRCYSVEDSFKDPVAGRATFCGLPLRRWLRAAGVSEDQVWDPATAPGDRTLWNARVFPAESGPASFRRWLWMFGVEDATAEQRQAFLAADRYSMAEMALLTDQEAFHSRRAALRAEDIGPSVRQLFHIASCFSAADLKVALKHSAGRTALLIRVLAEARWRLPALSAPACLEDFAFCRVLHSLGSSLAGIDGRVGSEFPGIDQGLDGELDCWIRNLGLRPELHESVPAWAGRLRGAAFRRLNETILQSASGPRPRPSNCLRPDETIWGRAPARIELGGGWTDTPPYSLEYGGDVVNAAVNLNGQPPIHCYCRVIAEPVIRLSSIDIGQHVEITRLDQLLDYRRPGDSFALAKAALAISGFSPDYCDWPRDISLQQMLNDFGGGIELTTLVGIPKGSGLGTSSILGAVLIAVIETAMGRAVNQRELFHDVLRLEQALTTGGGWQDQIGGGVGGVKITSTRPGLIPDPRIHYVPSDLLDPRRNGGSTLLYYTGLTRLAKNILEQIVGGFLDRNPRIMDSLAREHEVAQAIAEAMGRKDAAAFGHYVNVAWDLQKRLCGDVSNEAIESLLARVRPHVHGMRISGAGSGGFLLMIAKSPQDAMRIRDLLEKKPLNERSRFFDFEINQTGLEVTTC